ncbi:CBS domain-containing protein [Oscillatoria sp. FACHB-1407]|uniref:CBS domain-containing protein n=1 Tax=Oscillatoria sp. FACHB-1407 TaxID=2692847 RepID=UPI00168655FB|nr:CBS domain-containing protein [Oscillatoria sp. FACHB-1407]MBD2462038.1 CBS domain-containing protein [Oscillatoria sp. FACHB-1407]
MDLILCHTTADFDTLGAAVGLTRLHPGSRVVVTGGAHPAVRDFLALHRDEYPLIERRSVIPSEVRSLLIVDTQWRDRLGKAAEWLDLPDVKICLYDHHLDADSDIEADERVIESVGAITTLVAEQLQAQQIQLTVPEATVMALGIHVDTGSLTYDHTTVRDAAALTWLMGQGASLGAIAEYVEPGLSPEFQDLLAIALKEIHTEIVRGVTLAWVLLSTQDFVPGLSTLASHVLSLTESDILLLAHHYNPNESGESKLTVIGRVRSGLWDAAQDIDLNRLLQPWGGGGHPKAAVVTLRGDDPQKLLGQLLAQIRDQIPHPPLARDIMSAPVRTIRPETAIAEAQRILLRYGHSGLSVVDAQDQLVGIISRRDIDIALHHGFSHAPVKGYMTPSLRTIAPETTLPEIESLMVTFDIGRLPVLDRGKLVGIVTRTDVLRQLHREKAIGGRGNSPIDEVWQPLQSADAGSYRLCWLPHLVQNLLRQRLIDPLWQVLMTAAEQAEQRGWQLYVVGGAVRDLLLADPQQPLLIDDIDLVVDGFHQSADTGAGVELARALQQTYPDARLQVHGRFQTAALLWHHDPALDSLWIDIATARTEFYPYPAANPEVEASSIHQDLYRRDFTINALAIRLTSPRSGELLDFFGGVPDLQQRQIRVLHANSFIEDPTRIYRAVRFAVRLGFRLEPQTEDYIHHAIASGIYNRVQAEMDRTPALQTRLRRELKYILEAPYWKKALRLLADLGALKCLHPTLELTPELWWRLRLGDRWLKRFDPQATLPHWQMLLEVLIVQLAPDERGRVAENLQLPAESIERLRQFARTQAEVTTGLSTDHSSAMAVQCNVSVKPSHVVQQLSAYDLPTLTLLALHSPRPLRRLIWQYLICWATIQAPLDGNDLKGLGYKPGKHFKVMLEQLRAATLDGEVGDRTSAEAFLATHFPLGSRGVGE